MSWISSIIAGVGSGMESRGESRQTNSLNKWMGRNYDPNQINAYAKQFNPWVWNAMQGKQGNGTAFDTDMYNIAQGKDISPWLLNQPLNQINQSAANNMANVTAQLGRSNMTGGLANGYALSNQMGKQAATANLYQNYGQWREQQRRSDLNWLMGLMQNSQNMGMNEANSLAQYHKQGISGWTKVGRSASAAGAAYGGGGGQQQQPSGGGGGGWTQQNQATTQSYGSPYGAGTGEDSMGGGGGFGGGGAGAGAGADASTYGGSGGYGGNGGGFGTSGGYTGNSNGAGFTGYDPRTQMGSGKIY